MCERNSRKCFCFTRKLCKLDHSKYMQLWWQTINCIFKMSDNFSEKLWNPFIMEINHLINSKQRYYQVLGKIFALIIMCLSVATVETRIWTVLWKTEQTCKFTRWFFTWIRKAIKNREKTKNGWFGKLNAIVSLFLAFGQNETLQKLYKRFQHFWSYFFLIWCTLTGGI